MSFGKWFVKTLGGSSFRQFRIVIWSIYMVIIPLSNSGILSAHGYEGVREKSKLARHRALMRVVRAGEPPLSLFRRLNVLMILFKRKDPKLSKIFKADRDWVRETLLWVPWQKTQTRCTDGFWCWPLRHPQFSYMQLFPKSQSLLCTMVHSTGTEVKTLIHTHLYTHSSLYIHGHAQILNRYIWTAKSR
jgi:hypothetical protein